MRRMAAVGATAMILFSGPVQAQSDYGGGWAVPSFETSQSIIRDSFNRRMMDRQILDNAQDNGQDGDQPVQPRQKRPANIATNPSALRFAASPAIRRSIETRFAATMKQQDPNGFFNARLPAGPPVVAMHKRMIAAGLTPDDVGSAVALYLATHWSMANRSATLPSRTLVMGLKSQFSAGLGSLPAFARADHASKQQFTDDLLLRALAFSAMIETVVAAGDQKSLSQLSSRAVRELKEFGVDPAQMTLSAQGFVAR